jgi:hypothetical protein
MQRLGFTLAAGTLVSVICFAWALVYLYRLARMDHDHDRATASVALLAAYPFAVFFSAPYTEALFLLTVLGAMYHMRRGELAAAGTWGLLAGLTRPNGCLLSIPLAMIALAPYLPRLRWFGFPERGSPPPAGPAPPLSIPRLALSMTAAAMPGVGMLLFSGFIYWLTGDPFRWSAVHRVAWDRRYVNVVDLFGQTFDLMRQHGFLTALGYWPFEGMNFLATAFALVLVVPVTLTLGWVYGAFTALNLFPPLIFGGWMSMARMTSVLFPMFVYLAVAIPRDQRLQWAAGFAVLQGLMAALFFTGKPVY